MISTQNQTTEKTIGKPSGQEIPKEHNLTFSLLTNAKLVDLKIQQSSALH